MPFCPKCGGEYREGFRECSDCLLELVDTPPKNPRAPGLDDDKPAAKAPGKTRSAIDNTVSCASCRPEVKLVMVYKARNDMEALEIKAMLSGANISAVAAESGGQQGRMEVPVFVDENDAADARKLINATRGGAVEADDEESVIYELEEGEELLSGEDDEEEDDEDEEQSASTAEEKEEELRGKMEGGESKKWLLIVLMAAIIIIIAFAYLYR